MTEPPQHDRPDGFLLLARNNQIDLRDFFALSGIDDTRVVHQVILVTGDDIDGKPEHSLTSSGHFNRARIFKAAVENGSRIDSYRGVEVLVVRPFQRDGGAFNDLRWLAVIDQKIAIFGTIPMVSVELDRRLAGAVVDPYLKERVDHLDPKDGTWCLANSFVSNQSIRRALNTLSPGLGDLLHDGDTFQFGTRFGGQVRFEYEISTPQNAPIRSGSDSIPPSLMRVAPRASLLASRSDAPSTNRAAHEVVKLSKSQYEKWIADVHAQENARE